MVTWGVLAAQYGSVSDIEIVWTLIALFGLGFAIWNFFDAVAGYRDLGARLNGLRQTAVASIKLEATRVVIQTIFVLIGVLAMTLKDPSNSLHQPWRVLLLGAVFRWGLVISAGLVMYQSYINFEIRRLMRAYAYDNAAPDPAPDPSA